MGIADASKQGNLEGNRGQTGSLIHREGYKVNFLNRDLESQR